MGREREGRGREERERMAKKEGKEKGGEGMERARHGAPTTDSFRRL